MQTDLYTFQFGSKLTVAADRKYKLINTSHLHYPLAIKYRFIKKRKVNQLMRTKFSISLKLKVILQK